MKNFDTFYIWEQEGRTDCVKMMLSKRIPVLRLELDATDGSHRLRLTSTHSLPSLVVLTSSQLSILICDQGVLSQFYLEHSIISLWLDGS